MTEFARDRRRKSRFDSGVAARVLTRGLFLFAAGDSRLYNLGIAGENAAEFLADIDGIANLRFSFAHYSS